MDDEEGDMSPDASAKASKLILDAIAAILADSDDTKSYVPIKGLLIYVYMKDDGKEAVHNFGTDGVWSTEAIGLCEVAKLDLLVSGLEGEEE